MIPLLPVSDTIRLSIQTGLMIYEAQVVIALRMMGMTGLLRGRPGENRRMVAEKSAAAAKSASAATRAAMGGAGPVAVAMAAVKPVRARTRSNARRLTRPAK